MELPCVNDTFLKMENKRLNLQVKAFHNGEAYRKLRQEYEAVIRKKDKEIRELNEELAESHAQNVAIRDLWFEQCEEIWKETDKTISEQREEDHGYRHEGRRFLCETDKEKTIAVFSHGGSGACVLAHLLHLPFPYVLSVMPYGLTSIITLYFTVAEGKYVFPRLSLFNDIAHTAGWDQAPQIYS